VKISGASATYGIRGYRFRRFSPNSPLSATVEIRGTVKMDNLAIKGVESDASRGKRVKPRGKQRKPFVIEYMIQSPRKSVLNSFGFGKWGVWARYRTAAARDQAYAALVKKEANSPHWWSTWKYRKRKEGGGGGTGPC